MNDNIIFKKLLTHSVGHKLLASNSFEEQLSSGLEDFSLRQRTHSLYFCLKIYYNKI